VRPSRRPTRFPTRRPTLRPTTSAPVSEAPSVRPSRRPTRLPNTRQPTSSPVTSSPVTPAPFRPPVSETESPTGLLSSVVTLTPSYDTFVDSMQAGVNYGSSDRLRVDGSPRSWVYIAFDMSPVEAAQITKATLRLYSIGDGAGGNLYSLPNAVAWGESEPTWLNVDNLISRVDEEYIQAIGWIDQENEWYEFDVTDSIIARSTSNSEIHTFLVKGRNFNGLSYASRERGDGELAPQLVLTYSGRSSIKSSPNSTPSRSPTRPPHGSTRPPTRRPTSSPVVDETNDFFDLLEFLQIDGEIPTIDDLTATGPIIDTVPSGCSDIDIDPGLSLLAFAQTTGTQVVFPSRDAHLKSGQDADQNYGSSATLEISNSSVAVLKFNLGEKITDISNIKSATLRLYVDALEESGVMNVFLLPLTTRFQESTVTWNSFGKHGKHETEALGDSYMITKRKEGRWINLDVTELMDEGDNVVKFVLAANDLSPGVHCLVRSRETCQSPKLVLIQTETNELT